MEALRICQKPEKGILTIKLPDSLANSKELEIIIFQSENKHISASEQFNPSDYFGVWQDNNLDADAICREMRDEWENRF